MNKYFDNNDEPELDNDEPELDKSPYLPCKLLTSLIEPDHCYGNFNTQTNNAMITSCRMQAYVSKELNKGIIYLSPILLTERTIAGYDIPDTHEHLVNLNAKERVKYRKYLLIEYRYRAGMLSMRP